MTADADRGQLVLVAAVAIAVALVPMLVAHAQLGVGQNAAQADAPSDALADGKRYLARAVRTASASIDGTVASGRERVAANRTATRLTQRIHRLTASGADRGVVYDATLNQSAASAFADARCPDGPHREFGTCQSYRGVVTQTRQNQTVVVAAAFDVGIRSQRGRATATYVYWAVNGSLARR